MKTRGKILKTDADKHLVFGWASVATDADGNLIVDEQGDTIPIDELERAAYEFVLLNRTGGEMHETLGVGTLVESMVFTPEKNTALGLSKFPCGWWIGMKIHDETVWNNIKSGKYSMFSIGGVGTREAVENE